MDRFHGDRDAGTIIDCPGAEVPRVKMTRNNDDLLGVLAAFEIGNDIRAFGIGQGLRRKNQLHFHCSFARKRRDQIGVFRRHGGRRNFRDLIFVLGLPRVRNSIVGAAH